MERIKDITELDKNFKVEDTIKRDGMVFYNALSEPFRLCGGFYKDGLYRRMPEDIAASVNESIRALSVNTAGCHVRFMTDSRKIAIIAKMPYVSNMTHFARTGSTGFDIYADNVFAGTFAPPKDIVDGYESTMEIPDHMTENKVRDFTINFPLYSRVSELIIGIEEGASLSASPLYKTEVPMVSYGSSITQGGCASRPGSSYQAILSRRFDCNYVNLGFCGNAKAEKEIAQYVASLDMSVFLYDYDCNAPTPDFLAETHEPMFKIVRAAHPTLPIIMMARPHYYLDANDVRRHAAIETTYKNALAAGDKNVYYLSGPELMALCGNEGLVDGCHPTDFGFASMAKAVGDLIEKIGCL